MGTAADGLGLASKERRLHAIDRIKDVVMGEQRFHSVYFGNVRANAFFSSCLATFGIASSSVDGRRVESMNISSTV